MKKLNCATLGMVLLTFQKNQNKQQVQKNNMVDQSVSCLIEYILI
jgi:hypothetical protein